MGGVVGHDDVVNAGFDKAAGPEEIAVELSIDGALAHRLKLDILPPQAELLRRPKGKRHTVCRVGGRTNGNSPGITFIAKGIPVHFPWLDGIFFANGG